MTEIYIIDANNEKIVLAKFEFGFWTCKLCDENEDHRSRMLHHIRFSHIQIG